MSKQKIRIFCFFAKLFHLFFVTSPELYKRLACEKLVFQQILFAKLDSANFMLCPLQTTADRLQLTLNKAHFSINLPFDIFDKNYT